MHGISGEVLPVPILPTTRLRERNRILPGAHYLVAESLGLVVCALPKSGCTALKRWLISCLAPDVLRDPTVCIHQYCESNYSLIWEHLQWDRDQVLSLAFVRDPLERIVSAFVEKFIRPDLHPGVDEAIDAAHALELTNQSSRDAVERPIASEVFSARQESMVACADVRRNRGLSFREFVTLVTRIGDDVLDEHWRPQSALMHGRPVDIVARADSMRTVVDHVAQGLGISRMSPERYNSSHYTLEAPRDCADIPSGELLRMGIRPSAERLLVPDLAEQLRTRFADDIALYERAWTEFPSAMDRKLNHIADARRRRRE